MLQWLEVAGLKLQLGKCLFMQWEVIFLGHTDAEEDCSRCHKREAQKQGASRGGEERESRAIIVTCSELSMVTAVVWRRKQDRDPDLQPVLHWLEAHQLPP